MKKQEFLRELCDYLEEKLPGIDTEEILEFYDDYFNKQTAQGIGEEMVAQELGDPRLIGKTIIDANYNKAPRIEESISEKAGQKPEQKKNIELKHILMRAVGLVFSIVLLYIFLRIFMFLGLFFPVLLVIGVVLIFFRNRR